MSENIVLRFVESDPEHRPRIRHCTTPPAAPLTICANVAEGQLSVSADFEVAGNRLRIYLHGLEAVIERIEDGMWRANIPTLRYADHGASISGAIEAAADTILNVMEGDPSDTGSMVS